MAVSVVVVVFILLEAESELTATESVATGAAVPLSEPVVIESVLVVFSELLLQEVKQTILRIAKNFFIVIGFDLLNATKVKAERQKEHHLFLPEKNTYWHSRKVEMFTQFIFKVIFVWGFNIIWKIAKESK